MSSPLIERLNNEFNYPFVDANNHQSFLEGDTTKVLFFTGNPNRYPETLDVAVVLPELVNAFNNQIQPAIVTEDAEDDLPVKYEFSSYPALIFIKQGFTVGTICKIQDWQVYLQKIQAIIDSHVHINHIIPTVSQESQNGR